MAIISRAPAAQHKPSALTMLLTMPRKGMLHFFEDTWRKHGDFVQVNIGKSTMFIVAHPDHVQHVTVGQGRTYDKVASYDSTRKFLLGNGVLTSTGALWKRQRKLMAPFFTPRSLGKYAPIIMAEGARWLERWEQVATAGKPVDMLTEMMILTARINVRSMFSTQDDEEVAAIKDDVETMIAFTSGRQMMPVQAPMWVPTPTNRNYLAARQRIHAYINRVIAQRRALPGDQWPEDILTALMRARDEETGATMADELVRDEAITLYFAGYETTARTLSFLWYALAQHPDVAARVQAEVSAIDATFSAGALHQLPYTLQTIKETMRLHSPVPMFARDAIAPDTIDGTPIPVGARMTILPFLTHRHPEFWPSPETFDPDRWTPEREAARHPYAYMPFASGQRICVGNHLAMFEGLVLAAMIARQFAPKLMPGYQPQWWSVGTLTAKNGLPMQITRI